MTYSLDFRKKVLSIREKEGLSFAQAAKRFGISVNSIFLWSKKLEPNRTKNRPPIKIGTEALLEDVRKYPDAYNHERAKRFNVSSSGISCALKRLGITYKKNVKSPKSLRKKTAIFQR